MLSKFARGLGSSIGSSLGAIEPGLVLKIADIAVKNNPSLRQTFLDEFTNGLATSLKQEIVSDRKIDPSKIAIIIALAEVSFRQLSPKSLWFTWAEQDLIDFLVGKVGIHIATSLKITEVYMTSIYDVMNASLHNEIDLDQLSTNLISNPEFMKYQ
jgi:hypothetical protein